MTSTISEKTRVPLSMVFTIFAAVLSGALWLGKLSFAQEQSEKDLRAVEASLKELQTSVVVELRDQSANLSEVRTQTMVIDASIKSLSERLERFMTRQDHKN